MTKLILIALIFFCCVWTGFLKSDELKQRYQNLCAIKAALSELRSQISFFGFDMSRALASVGQKSSAAALFERAAKGVIERGAARAWSEAVEEKSTELCLQEEDIKTLSLLSARLGMTDSEGQIKNIEGVSTMLDTNIADAKYNLDRYSSLYCGGGVLVGAFLGLVII